MATAPTTLSSALLLSSRRGYLQTLASLVGATAAFAAASSPAEAIPVAIADTALMTAAAPLAARLVSAPQCILLQTSPVAGFQYHEGESIWAGMRVGDELRLVREPSNCYDARAVRLQWNSQKIGYVPALDNAAISQLLDRGACLDAVITRLRESQDSWERVSFEVYLTQTA